MQKLKGLWIPVEILLNEDLSDKKGTLLLRIHRIYQNLII